MSGARATRVVVGPAAATSPWGVQCDATHVGLPCTVPQVLVRGPTCASRGSRSGIPARPASVGSDGGAQRDRQECLSYLERRGERGSGRGSPLYWPVPAHTLGANAGFETAMFQASKAPEHPRTPHGKLPDLLEPCSRHTARMAVPRRVSSQDRRGWTGPTWHGRLARMPGASSGAKRGSSGPVSPPSMLGSHRGETSWARTARAAVGPTAATSRWVPSAVLAKKRRESDRRCERTRGVAE
jgi:hypothetical protein